MSEENVGYGLPSGDLPRTVMPSWQDGVGAAAYPGLAFHAIDSGGGYPATVMDRGNDMLFHWSHVNGVGSVRPNSRDPGLALKDAINNWGSLTASDPGYFFVGVRERARAHGGYPPNRHLVGTPLPPRVRRASSSLGELSIPRKLDKDLAPRLGGPVTLRIAFDRAAGVVERQSVEGLVAVTPVEGLDASVVGWLAGPSVRTSIYSCSTPASASTHPGTAGSPS